MGRSELESGSPSLRVKSFSLQDEKTVGVGGSVAAERWEGRNAIVLGG